MYIFLSNKVAAGFDASKVFLDFSLLTSSPSLSLSRTPQLTPAAYFQVNELNSEEDIDGRNIEENAQQS